MYISGRVAMFRMHWEGTQESAVAPPFSSQAPTHNHTLPLQTALGHRLGRGRAGDIFGPSSFRGLRRDRLPPHNWHDNWDFSPTWKIREASHPPAALPHWARRRVRTSGMSRLSCVHVVSPDSDRAIGTSVKNKSADLEIWGTPREVLDLD